MIYVITKGSYSDYHIVGATTNLDNAEKIAKKFSDIWDECQVEAFVEGETLLRNIWKVYFKKNGDVWLCEQSDYHRDYYDASRQIVDTVYKRDYDLIVTVEADNEEAAIKIAAEKRAMYLANKNCL
jgi:hypothetical protein